MLRCCLRSSAPSFLLSNPSCNPYWSSHALVTRKYSSRLLSPRKTTRLQEANAHNTVKDRLASVSKLLSSIHDLVNWSKIQNDIQTLEGELEGDLAWLGDPQNTLRAHSRLTNLRKRISTYQELQHLSSEFSELAALSADTSDMQMQEELVPELDALLTRTEQYLASLWLSEPTDVNSVYVDIRAGSGGTEACDWAAMLTRMYTKWAYSRGFTVEVVEESPGDTTGIKATTLLLRGQYAYGYMQFETGVHRLVRNSPFDASGNTDGTEIELNPSDLKITTMRSQGAGGQHVNKTESAVRIVHLPTGLSVTCQQERSQHRNRALALSLLTSKLYEIELQKQAQSKADVHSALPDNAWGSQIRSYVLQPYQLIKDTRTGHEVGTGGVQRVLDGDLDGFLEASLCKFRRK